MPTSILSNTVIDDLSIWKGTIKAESDLIVTSVLLGFIGTRYHLNQPCQFDMELESPEQRKQYEETRDLEEKYLSLQKVVKTVNHSGLDLPPLDEFRQLLANEERLNTLAGNLSNFIDTINARRGGMIGAIFSYDDILNEAQEFHRLLKAFAAEDDLIQKWNEQNITLDSISYTFEQFDKDIAKHVQDGQSEKGGKEELIAGVRGGAKISSHDRTNLDPLVESKVVSSAQAHPNYQTIYQGRGGYTGVIHDPVKDKKLLQPSVRKYIHEPNRWNPGENNWGLIDREGNPSANLDNAPTKGMGPLHGDDQVRTNLIGYVHGMCSAIYACQEHGPWCQPFELSTGDQTTKISSCFPCTTYMYATGYPPSSTHLARGESWVPPAPESIMKNSSAQSGQATTYVAPIVNSALNNWHREIFSYMELGFSYLQKDTVKSRCLDDKYKDGGTYAATFNALNDKIITLKADDDIGAMSGAQKISSQGGNLFLDALTVHDKELSRVKRVLSKAYKTMNAYHKHTANKIGC